MSAGAIFVTTGLSEISTMGKLVKKMPVTSVCFAAASIGLAGMPLMVGFISKFNILEGAFALGVPFAVIALLAAALLALTYLIPIVQVFFGKESEIHVDNHGHGHHEHNGFDAAPAMLIPLMMTIILAIVLGFEPNAGAHLYDMALSAAKQIIGEGGNYLAQ
jgi:multicomponent Na+:H+ antiporter subunit D